MGHNGCDGSQASGPWAIGSGYRFKGTPPGTPACHPHSVQRQLVTVCAVGLVTPPHIRIPRAGRARAASPDCTLERRAAGRG